MKNIFAEDSELDDKIVLWGMSCVGKTTFAKTLDRKYHCFDALFPWHTIEGLGLSTHAALQNIQTLCIEDSFVLDGWHLSDPDCLLFPKGAVRYVLYSTYDQIIDQYRVEVKNHMDHHGMFRKWYHRDFDEQTKFILNDGNFSETSFDDFISFLECNQ